MEPQDLIKIWGAFDNKRLCAKQFSIRLPVHVAARISALCDMFPGKTKTDIIADLLASALDQLEKSLPQYQSDEEEEFDGHKFFPIYGPKVEFRNLANEYYIELEKELGNANPRALY